METQTAQELYDKAFLHYKQDEYPQAKEYIEQALSLAPEDLAVHALAMHIKINDFMETEDYSFLSHAEYIMDHNIHYRDTTSKLSDPNAIISEAIDGYDFMRLKYKRRKGLKEDTDRQAGKDIDIRFCKYAFKALQAGYPINSIEPLMDALERLERFDDLLKIASIILKIADGKEAGYPGIEKSCDEYLDYHSIIINTANAFYNTGRFEEAIEFFTSAIGEKNDFEHLFHNYLGDFYCLMDQPEETARQWIIAADKCSWAGLEFNFTGLCQIAADPEAGKKLALIARLYEVMDDVSEERKSATKSTLTQISCTVGNPEKKVMAESIVESKIGMKLPPETKEHYGRLGKLWLPGTMGVNPYGPALVKKQEQTTGNSPVKVSAQIMPSRPQTIEKFGTNITELARLGKLPPITGRDNEIDSLVRILIRMEKNNPVLLGPAGVGKTAIIQGLAQRIVSENVPAFLKNRRIFELSMSTLVAGATFRGDFEQRITGIINEARENTDIILFIDELHTIMGAGAATRGDLDAANIIKPALAKGSLRLVGSTTNQEYSKCIEADPAMARRFTPVRVGELDRNAVMEVLARRRDLWREHHKVEIDEAVLKAAVELSDLYVKNRMLPDKAIDLLDESCAFARSRRAPDNDGLWRLTAGDIHEVMMEWTGGVFENKVDTADPQASRIPSCSDIQMKFSDKIFGQEKAIEVLSRVVLQHRLSLKDPDIPVSLLFYGPRGSGKTACAEALASVLWPDEKDRLMQLNFYEYGDTNGLFRLIGPPPGFNGGGGGILSARLRRQPRSIIVLRNLTDGYLPVRRFFAQLLKNGIYMDSSGRKINASDAVIIVLVDTATHSQTMGFGLSGNSPLESVKKIIKSFEIGGEPGEFDGAFTCLVPFDELSDKAVKKVFESRLNSIRDNYAGKGLKVSFDKKFVKGLLEKYLKIPPEKRDMETFIKEAVVPRVREVAVERMERGN